MAGKFIVIEGADGTGKETQVQLLSREFGLHQIPHVIFDFPQYQKTQFGKLVGRFLTGEFGGNKDVNPYLAMLPFAGDRWQAASLIRQHLEKGEIVLANRYFLSNIAHQSVKLPLEQRDEFVKFAYELEYNVYNIPREDLNIVLSVSPEKSRELIETKRERAYLGTKKDIQEADFNYQLEVAEVYRTLPDRFSHIVGVDCMKNGELRQIEDIHAEIFKKVSRFLSEDKEGRIVRER